MSKHIGKSFAWCPVHGYAFYFCIAKVMLLVEIKQMTFNSLKFLAVFLTNIFKME